MQCIKWLLSIINDKCMISPRILYSIPINDVKIFLLFMMRAYEYIYKSVNFLHWDWEIFEFKFSDFINFRCMCSLNNMLEEITNVYVAELIQVFVFHAHTFLHLLSGTGIMCYLPMVHLYRQNIFCYLWKFNQYMWLKCCYALNKWLLAGLVRVIQQ